MRIKEKEGHGAGLFAPELQIAFIAWCRRKKRSDMED